MNDTKPIDYVVGIDPMSDNLAVIPLDVARADAALIRTLNSATLGEVRRGDPAALALVEEAYSYFGTNPVLLDEDDQDSVVPFDELPDSHPYEIVSWFGDDSYYRHIPLARLRTEEHAPEEIMEEFGNRDFGVGFVDYESADWLDPGDSEAIEARLRELGHRVVHDDRLLREYEY